MYDVVPKRRRREAERKVLTKHVVEISKIEGETLDHARGTSGSIAASSPPTTNFSCAGNGP
jgi:hypothetical protein